VIVLSIGRLLDRRGIAAYSLVAGALLSLPGIGSSHDAHAQAPPLTMVGLGAGLRCKEWLAEAQQDEAVRQWAFGFLSAMAAIAQLQQGGDPLGAVDADGIHAWLRDHCTAQPETPLSVALVRLLNRT